MTLFVHYYSILLATLAAVYMGGHIISCFLTPSKFGKSFNYLRKFIFGTLLSVVFIAIYFTGGKTVFIGLLIPLAALFLEYKKRGGSVKSPSNFYIQWQEVKDLFMLLLIATAIFAFRFYLNYGKGYYPILPSIDNVFYGRLSSYMGNVGVESMQMSVIYKDSVGVTPYHYFMLWLNVGTVKIFNVNSLLNLILVCYTFFTFIAFLGFCALLEQFYSNVRIRILVALLSILFLGFVLPAYSKISILSSLSSFSINIINLPKLSSTLIVFSIASIFFIHKQTASGYYCLLLLPIFTITTFTLFAAVTCTIILEHILFGKSKHWGVVINAVALATFILLFYFYFTPRELNGIQTVSKWVDIKPTASYWITAAHIIILTNLHVFLFYLPLVVLAIVVAIKHKSHFAWKENYAKFALPTSIFIFSLLGWALLNGSHDSIQVFTNILSPLALIIVLYLAGLFYKNKWHIEHTILVALLCMSAMLCLRDYANEHKLASKQKDRTFLQICDGAVKDGERIGFLFGKIDYSQVSSMESKYFILGHEMCLKRNSCDFSSLSVFEIPMDSTDHNFVEIDKLVSSTAFSHFVNFQKKANNFESIERSQVQFIEKNHIESIFLSKAAILPPLIKKRMIYEITDPVSGERFCKLRKI